MTGTGERVGLTTPVRYASLGESARVAGMVLAPIVMQGLIQRRLWLLTLLARLDADRWGFRLLRRLRERHGGAVLVRLPGRRIVLLLSPADVRRVLEGSPWPFTQDNREKHGALAHFQPHGVLVSTGQLRERRRAYNENLLDTANPVHRLGDAIAAVVRQEAGVLLEDAHRIGGRLDWLPFAQGFWRIVRRLVLGDAARDDREVTAMLGRLRSDGNWSYLGPRRTRLRQAMTRRIQAYLDRPEPGSLAALVAGTPAADDIDGPGQIPHWLFAFDGGGVAAFRLLALLATHPEQARRADEDRTAHLDYLRACLMDSVRLWPATLVVLRDSTAPTRWGRETLPPGTMFAAPTTFLHRDERLLPYADRFVPEIWLDGRADGNWSLIPFSGGPVACPGQNLVLLVTSTLVAELRRAHWFTLLSRPALAPDRPLPRSLSYGVIRLGVTSRPPA